MDLHVAKTVDTSLLTTMPERIAYQIVKNFKTTYQGGNVQVTDHAYYKINDLVQTCRKNYLGVYKKAGFKGEHQINPQTGKPLIWVPITEWSVDELTKNVDIDTKDITVTATSSKTYGTASAMRFLLINWLKRLNFGEDLNDIIRFLLTDGSQIIKSYHGYNMDMDAVTLKTSLVDTMNLITDQSARNLQEAPGLIELMSPTIDMFQSMGDKWQKVDQAKGVKQKPSFYKLTADAEEDTDVPYVPTYDYNGKIPAWIVDGKASTAEIMSPTKWIEGRIVLSNMDDMPVVHLIKSNEKKFRPYEDIRGKHIRNRLLGRGTAEALIGIQYAMNEQANIRQDNFRIFGPGMFKYTKRAGVTQAKLARMRSGGSIELRDMDEFEQLPMQDITANQSMANEDRLMSWAEKQTATPAIARGETLPASRSATAASLEDRRAESAFSLMREQIGLGLGRTIERHWLPIILDQLKDDDVISVIADPKELQDVDEMLLNHFANEAVLTYKKQHGVYPDPQLFEREKQAAKKKLGRFDKARFFRHVKGEVEGQRFGVTIDVGDEEVDKQGIIDNLTNFLVSYNPVLGGKVDTDAVALEIFDQMGLGGKRFYRQDQNVQIAGVGQGTAGTETKENAVMLQDQGQAI